MKYGPTEFCIGTSSIRGLLPPADLEEINNPNDRMSTTYDDLLQRNDNNDDNDNNNNNNNKSDDDDTMTLLEFCIGRTKLSCIRGRIDYNALLLSKNQQYNNNPNDVIHQIQEFERYVTNGEGEQGSNNKKASASTSSCPNHLHRIPLLNIGDVVLFDYMLTHRGGANRSNLTRSMIFAMYSRKWYKDTTFDIISHDDDDDDDTDRRLTKLTRYAIPSEEEDDDEEEEED